MHEPSYNFSYNSPLIKKVFVALGILVSLCALVTFALYMSIVRAPSGTVYPVKIIIENGQGAQSIARELTEAGITRSLKFTQNLIVGGGGEKKISAGLYVFSKPLTVFNAVKKMVNSEFGYVPVKLTIPEGVSVKKISEIVHIKFPLIATSTFLTFAKEKEGHLFPETYFFPPEATSTEIISRMELEFNKNISKPDIKSKIEKSNKTLEEILKIASILEEEVQTTIDRKIVADLLNRRIKMGMPLQVDATLAYVTGKTSAELTLKDLRTDGPYNSYTNKGLPPTPISNPGLDAIEAVLDPTPNEYLFYLSDKDGITHFSKTYEEHLRLKAKYLR